MEWFYADFASDSTREAPVLDYFREFQTLAAHLNFTTAARELGLTQSCLSRHILTLEREIGFKLLERTPVRLTPAGLHFLTGVGQAFTQIDEVTAECKKLSKMGPQTITIAMIQANDLVTAACYHALSELHKEFPGLAHHFDSNRSMTIRKVVETGRADVGILCHVPEDLDAAFCLEHLFDNPFGAIMHKDDPLARGPLHFADLSVRAIVFSANRQFTTWVEGMRDACERYGCMPEFRMKDADTIQDFLVMLQPGEVVFARPDLFRPELTNADLVCVPFADETPHTYSNYLLYSKSESRPVVLRFLELMRQEARHAEA